MARKLVIQGAYCTRMAGSGCARCGACCPVGAILLPDGPAAPAVDFDACTGCGICFGVCDAFASTRVTLEQLRARLRRIAVSGLRVYLTCKEDVFEGLDPAENVVVLPCLSMLSPELWTLLLAENIRVTIAHDLKYCEDCTRAPRLGGELYPRAVAIAEQRTDGQVKFAVRIPEDKAGGNRTAADDPTDRRAAFTGLVGDLGQIASGKRRLRNSKVLADYAARKERRRATERLNLSERNTVSDLGPDGRMRHLLFPKQRMLLEAVERRHDIAGRIPVLVSSTLPDVCTGSGECAAACPTGARTAEGGSLAFDALYCVGCGACYEACPTGAVGIEEATAQIYLDAMDASGKDS